MYELKNLIDTFKKCAYKIKINIKIINGLLLALKIKNASSK